MRQALSLEAVHLHFLYFPEELVYVPVLPDQSRVLETLWDIAVAPVLDLHWTSGC